MLEKNINKYTTNCRSNMDFVIIAKPNENSGIGIVMTEITEEEEHKLDLGKIVIKKDFTIYPNLCFVYGELDFSSKSKDLDELCKSKILNNFYINQFMVSEYDYNTHTVTSDIKNGRWYESSNPKVYLPYLHGCLGKPERIAIFKVIYKPIVKNNKKVSKTAKDYTNVKSYDDFRNNRRKEKVSKMKFTLKKL